MRTASSAIATCRLFESAAEYTATYFEDVVPQLTQWAVRVERQRIANLSDADWVKWDEERTRQRQERQSGVLHERALSSQERAEAMMSKEKFGADIWQMTPEQFKEHDARRKAISRASQVDSEALAAHQWEMRVKRERERNKQSQAK